MNKFVCLSYLNKSKRKDSLSVRGEVIVLFLNIIRLKIQAKMNKNA